MEQVRFSSFSPEMLNSPNAISTHQYTPNDVAAVSAIFCGIPGLSAELRNVATCAILWAGRGKIDPCTTAKNSTLDTMYVS